MPPPGDGQWRLLLEDTFDRDSPLGPGSVWEAQLGNGAEPWGIPGWGNNEVQHYTARHENVRIECTGERRGDGSAARRLVIEARHEPGAPEGQRYTSARIRTAGRFSVAPIDQHPCVYIEARLAVTPGLGLWPAFWLLPEHPPTHHTRSGAGEYGGWAASGELDVMERCNNMQQVIGSVHWGGPWPANRLSSAHAAIPAEEAGTPHTYAVEWQRGRVRWFLDGRCYFEARSARHDPCGGWRSAGPGSGPDAPFDRPFHLILNLALGSPATEFTRLPCGTGVTEEQLQATLAAGPCRMQVDWVRVWAGGGGSGPAAGSGGDGACPAADSGRNERQRQQTGCATNIHM